MERIEDLAHPHEGCLTEYRELDVRGVRHASIWLPALPIQPTFLRSRLLDAWAVWKGKATAVQWPHQRDVCYRCTLPGQPCGKCDGSGECKACQGEGTVSERAKATP